MPGCINNIYFDALIHHGSILGKNSNPAFSFQIIAVHHEVIRFGEFPQIGSGLLKKRIHQGSFSVIDVGNDGNIAYFHQYFLSFRPCLLDSGRFQNLVACCSESLLLPAGRL
jgi:hypothetical protein